MRSRSDWPQDITPRQTGPNFRPDAEEARKSRKPQWRAQRIGNDPLYVQTIRSFGCLLGCQDENVATHFHHLKSGPAAKERGVYMKATDRYGVGLCFFHHNEVERLPAHREPDFFRKRGVRVHLYAKQSFRSWETYRDPARLHALFIVYQQDAIRLLAAQYRETVRGGEAQTPVGHKTRV